MSDNGNLGNQSGDGITGRNRLNIPSFTGNEDEPVTYRMLAQIMNKVKLWADRLPLGYVGFKAFAGVTTGYTKVLIADGFNKNFPFGFIETDSSRFALSQNAAAPLTFFEVPYGDGGTYSISWNVEYSYVTETVITVNSANEQNVVIPIGVTEVFVNAIGGTGSPASPFTVNTANGFRSSNPTSTAPDGRGQVFMVGGVSDGNAYCVAKGQPGFEIQIANPNGGSSPSWSSAAPPVGGGINNGGLAVRPSSKRLYAPGSAGVGCVSMYDTDPIPGLATPNGSIINALLTPTVENIIYIPTQDTMWVTDSANGLVIIIDCTTNAVTTSFTPGMGASTENNMVFCASNDRVYMTNSTTSDVKVLNSATGALVTTIASGLPNAHYICHNTVTNRIYVATRTASSGAVCLINPVTNTVVGTVTADFGGGANYLTGICYTEYTDAVWTMAYRGAVTIIIGTNVAYIGANISVANHQGDGTIIATNRFQGSTCMSFTNFFSVGCQFFFSAMARGGAGARVQATLNFTGLAPVTLVARSGRTPAVPANLISPGGTAGYVRVTPDAFNSIVAGGGGANASGDTYGSVNAPGGDAGFPNGQPGVEFPLSATLVAPGGGTQAAGGAAGLRNAVAAPATAGGAMTGGLGGGLWTEDSIGVYTNALFTSGGSGGQGHFGGGGSMGQWNRFTSPKTNDPGHYTATSGGGGSSTTRNGSISTTTAVTHTAGFNRTGANQNLTLSYRTLTVVPTTFLVVEVIVARKKFKELPEYTQIDVVSQDRGGNPLHGSVNVPLNEGDRIYMRYRLSPAVTASVFVKDTTTHLSAMRVGM